MSNKKCLVYETLGNISDMKIVENKSDNGVRLSGVFGVCGVKNGNNRIYSKENYGRMVENLQKVIMNEGCLGELEHPNTMNINLDNVSHKIESIEMDESGTITGTIRLLDTVKGKNAKAIVEAGCPLFISSRGAGSIDEAGNVTLSTIKTYDLVGTPGFSQAKLTLKKNQKFESLNENLSVIYEEEDDLLGTDDDDKKEGDDEGKSDDKEKEKEEKPTEEPTEKPTEEPEKEDNKDINNNKVTMEEIKKAIDTLTDKVTSLEAELHVAQESLAEQIKKQDNADYDAIQEWATQEFKADLLDEVMTSVKESIDENNKHVAEGIQNWVNEAITPEIQNWIVEEFTPEIQNWITEEYSDKVQNWITEEFGSTIEGWVNEEFAATVEGWINEEFAPSQKEAILNEAYENVNMFIESKKEEKLDFIDKMLEGIDTLDSKTALDKIVKEQEEENKFKGVYVVENMPNQYKPLWNGLSESKQNEIIRSSRMYDFTKEGVLESFWANADLTEVKTTKVNESVDVISNYHNNIAEQMKRYGKWY